MTWQKITHRTKRQTKHQTAQTKRQIAKIINLKKLTGFGGLLHIFGIK